MSEEKKEKKSPLDDIQKLLPAPPPYPPLPRMIAEQIFDKVFPKKKD